MISKKNYLDHLVSLKSIRNHHGSIRSSVYLDGTHSSTRVLRERGFEKRIAGNSHYLNA